MPPDREALSRKPFLRRTRIAGSFWNRRRIGTRSSFAACVDYIAGLCDESYTDLPAPNNVNFGRASKGAALALKARLLLYAASPLYNGKGYDGSDNEFICYGSYDKKRWESAAAAAADRAKLRLQLLPCGLPVKSRGYKNGNLSIRITALSFREKVENYRNRLIKSYRE